MQMGGADAAVAASVVDVSLLSQIISCFLVTRNYLRVVLAVLNCFNVTAGNQL